MSQFVSFKQFDKKSIDDFFNNCIKSNFSISDTQSVPGISDIIKGLKKSGTTESDIEDVFYEMYDSVLHHYSKREYSEYLGEMLSILEYWVNIQTKKNLRDDLGEKPENIDPETWQQIFASGRKLSQIESDLKSGEAELSSYGDVTAEHLLDAYLQIKGVFEYCSLTDTSMVFSHEDPELNEWQKEHMNELLPRVKSSLKNVTSQEEADTPKHPPFATMKSDEKWFFIPIILVASDGATLEVGYEDAEGQIHRDIWAGRVLPDQTFLEVISRELHELYGYNGSFNIASLKVEIDRIPDNSGNEAKRYEVYITLKDSLDINKKVMNHKLKLIPHDDFFKRMNDRQKAE